MKRSLTKDERITHAKDIERIFTRSRKQRSRGVTLLWRPNATAGNRIIVIPVKARGAVERNRTKRLGREAYRHLKHDLRSQGYDFAFLLYPGMYTYWDRLDQMKTVLKQANIFAETGRIKDE